MPKGNANGVPVNAPAPVSNGTDDGIAMEKLIDAMPIIARRPFLSSDNRFSASYSAVRFFVKPGVSQNRLRNFRLPGSPPLV